MPWIWLVQELTGQPVADWTPKSQSFSASSAVGSPAAALLQRSGLLKPRSHARPDKDLKGVSCVALSWGFNLYGATFATQLSLKKICAFFSFRTSFATWLTSSPSGASGGSRWRICTPQWVASKQRSHLGVARGTREGMKYAEFVFFKHRANTELLVSQNVLIRTKVMPLCNIL